MALFSWLLAGFTACGDDDPPPPPGLGEGRPLGVGAATAGALSPDGRWVAAGTARGLALYARGELNPRWTRPTDTPVRAVAFSGDGQRLAAVARGGAITVFDLAGEVLGRHAVDAEAPALALSPDGLRVAVADVGLTVFGEGQPPEGAARGGGVGPVRALAWRPDGGALAACTEAGEVLLWEGDAPLPRSEKLHERHCRGLAWSPDGARLASVGRELVISRDLRALEVWPPSKGTLMSSVAFSRDGGTLITGMDQGWAQLLDAATGAHGPTLDGLFSAPARIDTAEGGLALVQAEHLSLWDLTRPARVGSLPSAIATVDMALSPDGARLALATRSLATVMALPGGEALQVGDGFTHFLFGLDFAPDGALVAASRREVLVLGPEGPRVVARPPGERPVEAAAVNPRDGRLAVASVHHPTALTKELRVSLWDTRSGEALPPLLVDAERPSGAEELIWRRDGGALLITEGSGARVVDDRGGAMGRVDGLRGGEGSSAWLPDGSRVLTLRQDGALLSWDPAGGAVEVLPGPKLPAGSSRVLVSADGAWSVAAAQGQDASLIVRGPGGRAQALPPLDGTLHGLALHPGRPLLAAGLGSAQGTGRLLLFDLQGGTLILERDSGLSHASALAWTADGSQLLASMDGGVVAWPLEEAQP